MARKLDVMSPTTSCLLYSLVTRQWVPLRLITQQLNSQSHYYKPEYNTERQYSTCPQSWTVSKRPHPLSKYSILEWKTPNVSFTPLWSQKQLNLTTHMAKHANRTTQTTVLSRDSLPTDADTTPVNKIASPSRQILTNARVKITANQWPITKWRTQRNSSTNTRQPINGFHSRLLITRQQQSPYFQHIQPITDAHVLRDHGIPMYVTHTN